MFFKYLTTAWPTTYIDLNITSPTHLRFKWCGPESLSTRPPHRAFRIINGLSGNLMTMNLVSCGVKSLEYTFKEFETRFSSTFHTDILFYSLHQVPA